MEFIEALRVVFDLASGNELNDDEADTPELKAEAKRQDEALTLIFDILERGASIPAVGYRQDNCPSKHWNRGDGVCFDCGANLN